jgi:hypothetical protein
MAQINQSNKCINLKSNSQRTTVGIKRKSPSDSHRTLGFHLQGDVKSDSHKKVMREKAEAYGEAISGSLLQRGESITTYNSYYMLSCLLSDVRHRTDDRPSWLGDQAVRTKT